MLQGRQDWQNETLRPVIAALVLSESQGAVLNVLASQPRDIGATLSCEQQEGKRKPSFGSYWMTFLEPTNLFGESKCEAYGSCPLRYETSRAGLEAR